VSAGFWERRRAAVRAEAEAEVQAVAFEEPQVAESAEDDAAILERLGLPDPDTLKKGDDFAAFMARAVPLHLRNRALRRLWRSDPVLACVDGLNDYDDDFLTGSTGNGPIRTAYQVGKGMLAHVERMAELKELAGSSEEPEEEPLPEAEPVEEEAPVEVAEAAEEAPPAPPAPRRMVFAFGSEGRA
jgi:hypothetical protein